MTKRGPGPKNRSEKNREKIFIENSSNIFEKFYGVSKDFRGVSYMKKYKNVPRGGTQDEL